MGTLTPQGLQPTILEVYVQLHNLTKEQLSVPISSKKCKKFSESMTEWEPLAPRLGLRPEEIAEIRYNNRDNLRGQCSACLTKWQRRHGRDATYWKLAMALEEAEDKNSIDKLCEEFDPPIPVPRTSISTEVSQFERRFSYLSKETFKAIKDVSLQDLQVDLALSQDAGYKTYITENLLEKFFEGVSTTTQLFMRLGVYLNHFNYSLLKYLVNVYGSAELQGEMNKYVTDMESFWHETTVADFINSENRITKYNKVPEKFVEIKCVIETPVAEVSLFEVEQCRLELAREYNLHTCALMLYKLEENSLDITWLLDERLLPQFKSHPWDDDLLGKLHVKEILVDKKLVYPVKAPYEIIWNCTRSTTSTYNIQGKWIFTRRTISQFRAPIHYAAQFMKLETNRSSRYRTKRRTERHPYSRQDQPLRILSNTMAEN